MLGTASTQQLFASANSIGVIPQIWAEWNYNSFISPAFVTSGSGTDLIPSNFTTSTTGWSATQANITLSSDTRSKNAFSSPSSISVKLNGLEKTTIAYSPSMSLNANSYYKLVFYTKVGNLKYTSNTPNRISTNSISLTQPPIPNLSIASASAITNNLAEYTIGAGGDTTLLNNGDSILISGNSSSQFNGIFKVYLISSSTKVQLLSSSTPFTAGTTGNSGALSTSNPKITYYYRIVPYGSNGQSPGPDTINNSDVVSISATQGYPVNISWQSVANANSYKIYRASSPNKIMFLNTTSIESYTDPAYSNSIFNENDFFNGKINFNAVVQNAKLQKCKIFETETGNPVITQNSIASNMERWQKIEIEFSTTSVENYLINFNISAEHLNAEVLFTDFHLYNISNNDFLYSETYPAETAFFPNRPGEALLHPLLPSSDKIITNKTNNVAYSKPVSFLTKSTNSIYSDIFPTYQVVSSYDDKFKYYLTGSTGVKSLQAFYENYLSINKIVLKIDNSLAIPKNLNIKIGTGSTPSFTTIPVTNSDINDNGILILYYNGTGWSTSSWTSPPQLNSQGKLQNIVTSVSSIQVYDTSNSYIVGKSAKTTDNILRIIEFSPRLEIDLSNYVESLNVKKDLTSAQSMGLPFSYINSNSGEITFSNIPSIQSNSIYGQTTFENDAKNSVFGGLLRQGVKFTGMLKPSLYENNLKETIPLFVMYSDTWSINDLDTAVVNLYDITKLFFMGSESMFFFQKDTNAFNVISGLLDYSGFSDYDYNRLSMLPDINAGVTAFWTDEKKAVFTALQEFLIPQQIGAYIDEYGILRFNSIAQLFNQYNSKTFTPNFAVTDFTIGNVGSSSATYISNIISSQFSESINEKIGGIVVNYKTPVVFNSSTIQNFTKSIDYVKELIKPATTITESSHEVWKEKDKKMLMQTFFNNDILVSDNKISFPIGSFNDDGSINIDGAFSNARRSIVSYNGDFLINTEIIGYDGMEYKFFDVSNPNYTVTKIIRQESDFNDAISDYKLYSNQSISSSIQYEPTGYLTNVIRGKYGTTPQDHKIYTNVTSLPLKFYSLTPKAIKFYSASNTKSNAAFDSNKILYLQSSSPNYSTIALVSGSNNYNYFTTSIKVESPNLSNKFIGWYLKKDKNKKTVTFQTYAKFSSAKKKLYAKKYREVDGEVEVGVVVNALNSYATNNYGTYFFSFYKNVELAKANQQYTFTLKQLQSDGTIKTIQVFTDPKGLQDIFDGDVHTISIFTDGSALYLEIDSNGAEGYFLNSYLDISNKSCGVYIRNYQDNIKNLYVYEFYGQTKNSSNKYNIFLDKYYFTSKDYINSVIDRVPYTAPDNFLYQQPIVGRQIIFYDIKMDSVPVITSAGVDIQKISYFQAEITSGGSLASCKTSDITYSKNIGSSFNRKFALVHNGPLSQGLISLSGGNGSKTQTADSTDSGLKLIGRNMYSSTEHVITRVIDKNYLQNTIQISTDWVKDLNQIENIITNISRANNGFNIDYQARIFGNPLIQVGDFAQVTYKLKRLGIDPTDNSVSPIIGLVTSVTQNYKDGLENTAINIKPMIIT